LFTLPGGGSYKNVGVGITGLRATGPSSYHPGGCHFAKADASVHFLSEDIAAQILWDMATRAGGEIVTEL
jgi:hypothetical protein